MTRQPDKNETTAFDLSAKIRPANPSLQRLLFQLLNLGVPSAWWSLLRSPEYSIQSNENTTQRSLAVQTCRKKGRIHTAKAGSLPVFRDISSSPTSLLGRVIGRWSPVLDLYYFFHLHYNRASRISSLSSAWRRQRDLHVTNWVRAGKGREGTFLTIMERDDVDNALLRSEAGPAKLSFEPWQARLKPQAPLSSPKNMLARQTWQVPAKTS